ncbi:MAG TPA: hypothetical protein VFO52_13830 [Longimicrobiales bacterium]|nr:hypothetical protein [Longimicrobiales bacterium]
MVSTKRTRYAMAALLVMIAAAPVFAQAPAPPASAPPGSQPEPKLAFDREVFSYPAEGRRDPFKPLMGGPGSGGPLFADLTLRGIIYSPDARRSVALVQTGNRRTYRLRRGDIIGNARVLEIQPLRVRFAVENFGTVRNETLDLRGNTQIRGEAVREAAPATSSDSARARLRNAPRLNPDTVRQQEVRQ